MTASFFCCGRGGKGDHTLVPAAPCTDSTGLEHVQGHELRRWDPRDSCARSGVRGWRQQAATALTGNLMLRFGHGGTDPVRGPRRHLPFAASSGRRVLAFLSPSALLLVPAAVKAGCCVPRLVEQALHSPLPPFRLCLIVSFFCFCTVSAYLESLISEFQ